MRFIIPSLLFILTSCKTAAPDLSGNTVENREADRQKVQTELGEVSLKADRDQLAELRKEIPVDKQKSNDELALYLNLMKQGTEQPNLVREKYNTMVQKKRTVFRIKVARLREDYRRDETKKREEFLREHKNRRDDFTKAKHDSKERTEFFNEQEKIRQRYMADERDKRSSFEGEINAQSKDFESYMRERNNEFNEQFRLYSKQFSEKQKEKKAVTGEGGFEKLKNMEAEKLEPGH